MTEKISTDVPVIETPVTPEKPVAPEVPKLLTFEDVEVYKPIKDNINYHWERIFKLGGLCYGAVASKEDNKLKITYNIDPDNLHPDYFVLISEKIVPKKVYELFKQKVYADIARLDSMMYNIVKNKSMLSTLTKFVDENIENGTEDLTELEAYTQEDAEADRKLEQTKMMNNKRMIRSPQAQKKALRKAKAKGRKINRKKK